MSTISVDYDVLNQRGSPAWFSDTFANIPTAGFKGRMFISTDTFAFYRDTGTGWDLIGGPGTGTLTGSGVAGQVSFFNGTQTITGNNNLFWDNTNSRLGIGTITPLGALHLFVSAGTTRMLIDGNAGQSKIITYRTNGLQRFGLYVSNTAESGSNVGSDFQIRTYNDAGTLLTTPFFIKRSSGRVGINNITPSYDLDVTGTFRATSTAIFGSTLGNGTYTYTLPSATGTLALLQSAQTFSGLNSFSLSISAVGGVAFPSTIGGSNYGGILGTANFFQISAQNGSSILMLSSNGTSAITINTTGNVNFGSTIGNGTYTYTLPSATGTLSLTSDLGSYLPLTGGTLTGQLYINPANTGITGLDVASNNTSIRSDTTNGFPRQLLITMGSGTLIQLTAKGFGANYGTDLAFYTATTGGVNASPGIYITGTNNRVGIKTGTPANDLDVAGTFGVSSTSTFTGDVTMSATSGVRILSVQTGGIEGRITATSGAWYIGSQSAVPLVFTTGGSGMMSIATSGSVSYVSSLIPTAAVNSGYFTIDSAANILTLGALGSVNIGSFSGMVLVTNTNNGVTMLFLCGGGGGTLVSQSIGGAAGTMTNFAGSGYTFTTAYTSTGNYTFQTFRTRTIA